MANYKKEGTSQTYGQLLLFPFKSDNVPTSTTYASSPKDILVKLIPAKNSGVTRNLTVADIDEEERKKILLTAFSDNPNLPVEIGYGNSIDQSTTIWSEGVDLSTFSEKIQDYAIVVGGEKTKDELKKIIKNAALVDSFITLKSKDSEEAEYNNLKDANISAKFVYNNFSQTETDIVREETPSLDPLTDSFFVKGKDKSRVPRYVSLTWPLAKLTEPLLKSETNSRI